MLQQTELHRHRRRDSLADMDDTLCEHVGSLFDQGDRQGPLGFNEYRMRRAEAIGKHGCLVFVASSLWHLTGLPAGPDRMQGLMQTMGDACRHQGRALLQKLLVFVPDRLSDGATADQVFVHLFAKQQGLALV
jgi:hypothetical protein